MVSYFESIDDKKTIKNVRDYLDTNFRKLMDICGISASQLQSPTISDMPFSKGVGNSSEDRVIKLMKYRETLKFLVQVLKGFDGDETHILFNCYVNGFSAIKIMQLENVSSAQYYRLKNKELLKFADRALSLIDLHVYK
ncbi:ArpU family phage packaging/lysis transcriptional regulator [Fructilactobacillus frigidiflavus]|uniref:ArpU family phage packaging/lysis transcriptional regulator n=1 Tax=Fructilactobacillus frigidiflavus TaxID=3242688 RepID=UPI00375831FC